MISGNSIGGKRLATLKLY